MSVLSEYDGPFDEWIIGVWNRASKPTDDEALCRARWGYAMGLIDARRIYRPDEVAAGADIGLLWSVAVQHRYNYAVDPPGYHSGRK